MLIAYILVIMSYSTVVLLFLQFCASFNFAQGTVDVAQGTVDATGDVTDQTLAIDEITDRRPIETLVNLICDCKIEDACEPEPEEQPQDCFDILQQGHTRSGKYNIYPFGNDGPLLVYCDMDTDGGGWTIFQKREDDSVDFYLGWDDYRDGFGYVGGDYWLGNKYIFMITNQERYKLRVDLEDFEGETAYAEYDHFRISDEAGKFKLSLGTYSGTAGDSLSFHADQDFSTKDRDNDNENASSCATTVTSAWWYKDCFRVDLNAPYLGGAHSTAWRGIIWFDWKGNQYSLRRTEMKIRPHGRGQ